MSAEAKSCDHPLPTCCLLPSIFEPPTAPFVLRNSQSDGLSLFKIFSLAFPHFLHTKCGHPAFTIGTIKSSGNVAKWASLKGLVVTVQTERLFLIPSAGTN